MMKLFEVVTDTGQLLIVDEHKAAEVIDSFGKMTRRVFDVPKDLEEPVEIFPRPIHHQEIREIFEGAKGLSGFYN